MLKTFLTKCSTCGEEIERIKVKTSKKFKCFLCKKKSKKEWKLKKKRLVDKKIDPKMALK